MRRFKTKNLSEQQAAAVGATVNKKTAEFNFQFAEGKYLLNEIPEDQLNALANQLIPIFKELRTPTLTNSITNIKLTANTSSTPINQKGSLPAAGITNNQLLAEARMNTLESIITDLLKKTFTTVDPAVVLAKVTFEKKTNPGTDTRIGIIAEQMGNSMVAPLPCNMPAEEIKGIQGTAANGYVAYDKTHELVFTLDSKATITFNPLQIPDAFWIKYGDQEKFSGFIGAATYGQEQTNSVNALKKIPNLVDTINGVIAKNGGTAKADINTIFNGIQQGGQSQFTFPLTKDFKNDVLRVIVFAPLSKTLFEISTNCQ
jgi:hypothetical protein